MSNKIDLIEYQLENLFQKQPVPAKLNDKIIESVSRPSRLYLHVAAIIGFVVILFNPITISLAEELPFIEDIMEYFNRDLEIEHALLLDYPVESHVFEGDGYKLIVKDIMVDKSEVKFKYVILNNLDQLDSNLIATVFLEDISDKPTYSINSDGNPWSNFEKDVSNINNLESISVKFQIKKFDTITDLEYLEIDLSHLNEYEEKHVDINKEMKFAHFKLELDSLDIHPMKISLEYEIVSNKDYHVESLDANLSTTDDTFDLLSITSRSDTNVYNSTFKYSNFKDISTFNYSIESYVVHEIEELSSYNDMPYSFDYNGNRFTINVKNRNLVVTCDHKIDISEFPKLGYQYNEKSYSFMDDRRQGFLLTKTHLSEALGYMPNELDEVMINEVIEYIKVNYHQRLSFDSLISSKSSFSKLNAVYIDVVGADLIKIYEVPLTSVQLGILSDFTFILLSGSEKIEVGKSISIPLK